MKIHVTKTVDIPSESLLDEPVPNPYYTGLPVIEVNTAYRRRAGRELLQVYGAMVASDAWGRYYQRISEDNGRTWSEPTVIFQPHQTEEGIHRWNEGALFLDEEKDRLLFFNNYSLYPETTHSRSVLGLTRIRMRMSSNGGPFSEPRQIIQRGHDEVNWADGVKFGTNCMHISFPAPLKLRNGKILLPVGRMPLNTLDTEGLLLPVEAGCMVGEWVGDYLEWDLGGMVGIDPNLSSRGLCEPALAELPDGAILMIMRGSNEGIRASGRRWRAISKDGARTWSKPEPLRYDTGEDFYSPASGSRLIRSSRNGKLYWLGNIVPENPEGSLPRQPVQIAEVDEHKVALKQDTVSVIDDRRSDDPPVVHLSNFRVYEDRETGEIVMNLARLFERGPKDNTSPSYQYRIRIEDD